MNLSDVVNSARESLTVKRVFGEPYEKDGLTIIPAAAIFGGGGGGEGHDDKGGQGEGGGFGLAARPAGAYVIRNGEVTWMPAVDLNRLVVSAGLISIVSMWSISRIVKAQAKARKKRR